MNAVTFEILKDMFLPIPYAIWVNKGDHLIIKKSIISTFLGWVRNDAIQKNECEYDSSKPFILIKAKNVVPNESVLKIDDSKIEETNPISEIVSNRSMKGRRRKVRTK